MDLLARVMFLLLCHITSLAKQIVFHTRAEDIDSMTSNFDDPLFNQSDIISETLLRDTAKKAKWLVTSFFSTAIVTCILWIVFPVVDHYNGRFVEFFFWMGGYDPNQPIEFEVYLIYSYISTTLVGIANTTMDAFMSTILHQCQTQMKILRINFEKMPEKGFSNKMKRDDNFDEILFSEFKLLLEHYNIIFKTITKFEDIFGIPILIQFTIGGWILCMAAFKIVHVNLLSLEFASMVLFIFCILLELFLYCFYGNEMWFESQQLMNSIYKMEWITTSTKFKKNLIFAMERAKKPLKPTVGGIIPLSLETYVKVLKSSYTFYAVLRETK